ncbi:ionotropic receptor 40a-like isoform X2 [Daktulosphaira vitifoliae]|uniref:ionotropic receptor 40a-like isoform X2 n=1 Tax=Daktulosphaira vitifoliae TaxID=58002 RepID=UPI0021AAF49F|nr:ionotropic receptor 40a-like isoform X2 [Daktulosphaira vitifoliae]
MDVIRRLLVITLILVVTSSVAMGRTNDSRSPGNTVARGVGVGGWQEKVDYENLTNAIRDIIAATTPPSDCTLVVHEGAAEDDFPGNTVKSLHGKGITTTHYVLSVADDVQPVLADINRVNRNGHQMTYVVFSTPILMESLISTIRKKDFTSRNIVYMFLWLRRATRSFLTSMTESMRVCVVTTPRPGFYQIYYNQASSTGRRNQLKMVNWWSSVDGLVRFPLLPSTKRVYNDFQGRRFTVPVLHKPPWTFVEYSNDSSFRVEGGRDDKLIKLLADKLNFRYNYMDPPDRTQGSGLDSTGSSVQGVLGLIWLREADWFVGDLSITYERNLVVDFSFLTLVDNEAFLTHAPGRLNEAFSLVRPFHWSVWPLLVVTVVLAGPILYLLIVSTVENRHGDGRRRSTGLFWKCAWWSVTVFLQQESPINTLDELSKAMRDSGLQLLVEVQSASQAMLENGTGVYETLSELVQRQREYLIGSTEKGMQLVRDNKHYAVIGGRETFYYDIKRFGAQHFHLSEKLNTRYSAIAFQRACPYIETFDNVLMRLFESGILSKITEEEYQKLNDKLMSTTAKEIAVEPVLEGSAADILEKDDDRHKIAMSMKTLQGAFYLLAIGSVLAGLILLIEVRSAKNGLPKSRNPTHVTFKERPLKVTCKLKYHNDTI